MGLEPGHRGLLQSPQLGLVSRPVTGAWMGLDPANLWGVGADDSFQSVTRTEVREFAIGAQTSLSKAASWSFGSYSRAPAL